LRTPRSATASPLPQEAVSAPADPSPSTPAMVEPLPDPAPAALELAQEADLVPGALHEERAPDISALDDAEIEDYLRKIRNFDADFLTDIHIDADRAPLLAATVARLERVQAFVGHGNFNLLGFDEMLYFARNYEAIGAFERAELDFLEEIFSFDA